MVLALPLLFSIVLGQRPKGYHKTSIGTQPIGRLKNFEVQVLYPKSMTHIDLRHWLIVHGIKAYYVFLRSIMVRKPLSMVQPARASRTRTNRKCSQKDLQPPEQPQFPLLFWASRQGRTSERRTSGQGNL